MHLTEFLEREHARIHELLERARAIATVDLAAYAEMRAELLRHIAVEEKLLFATVRRSSTALAPEEHHQLRIEHAALTSLLVPTPDLALLGELATLLATHDAREEGPAGIYARCESALGDASLKLAEQARAFPAVRVAQNYDGPGVHRTVASALASASRLAKPRMQPA